MSNAEPVKAERLENVLLLTLNRPDRLNAWTNEMEELYFSYLDEAEADEGVRAIVLTGAGRGFCAGADFKNLSSRLDDGYDLAVLDRPRPRETPMGIRKPLIAAINGPAFGLGLVEALFCDVRFCSRTAKLSTAFSRRGLIAEYGSAWILQRLVGQSAALDLLMSARTIEGEEAGRIGLVNFVLDEEEVLQAAIDYATDLARSCSPTAMAVIKEQARQSLDWSFAEALGDAEVRIRESFGWSDVSEGVASFNERRAPAFPPLSAV